MSHGNGEIDDLAYLSPDFDAATLTVPRLRNVLVTHNVNFLSSAKKPQLIQLFNDEVAPQAKKILAARARTKRSSRGIVDVPSSQTSVVDDQDEDDLPAPPPSRTKSSSRRTRKQVEDDGDATLVAPSTSKQGSSSKHAKSSDIEAEAKPATRRGRRTTTTPSTKNEDSDPVAWHRDDKDSPFTRENPFQSGSSPPVEATKRRKSELPMEEKPKRKSSASRRKTDNAPALQHNDESIQSSSHTYEMRVSELPKQRTSRSKKKSAENLLEPSEEFTPQEQQEMELEQSHRPQGAIIPVRRSSRRTRSEVPVVRSLGAVVTAIFIGIAYLWTREKVQVGYCGIGQPSKQIAGTEIPEWADFLRPNCEICPQHAFCYANLDTECEKGFVLRHHPLSLGGILPLPPTCEPDGEKAKRVKAVADRAVEALRERAAKLECGEADASGKPISKPQFDEEELKQVVSAKRRRGMSEEEFEELWKEAVGEIVGREEIVTQLDDVSGQREFASTSLIRISFACAIRRSIRLALARYSWPAVGFLVLLFSGAYARYRVAYNQQLEKQAEILVPSVFRHLAEYAADHAYDASGARDGFEGVTQLRDDMLRNELSSSRRNKVWKRVEQLVEQNSNVRAKLGTLDTGDVGRGWKWIGAVRALDDSGISSRRSSAARYSFGPMTDSSPMIQLNDDEGHQKGLKFSQWTESRPAY